MPDGEEEDVTKPGGQGPVDPISGHPGAAELRPALPIRVLDSSTSAADVRQDVIGRVCLQARRTRGVPGGRCRSQPPLAARLGRERLRRPPSRRRARRVRSPARLCGPPLVCHVGHEDDDRCRATPRAPVRHRRQSRYGSCQRRRTSVGRVSGCLPKPRTDPVGLQYRLERFHSCRLDGLENR